MSSIQMKAPLIAIIGATGTGKSQLAVELAKRFDGEVINGDAMQLYHGLPIITNKISQSEQQGIPHHLLGCIGLDESTWVVGEFVDKASKVIDEIRSRGRLPILVGGTHYYTQNLLFAGGLADEAADKSRPEASDLEKKWPILAESSEAMLQKLREVDPVSADRWHPNDRRKIRTSLLIFLQTGKRASDVYAEQRTNQSVNTLSDTTDEQSIASGSPRYSPLLFWVHAEKDILNARLEARVDDMLERGLLDEIRLMKGYIDAEKKAGRIVNETTGIWVSIGFKEFKQYYTALEQDDRGEELPRLQLDAIERTKIATRQYAKRQIRWINIKLRTALSQAGLHDRLYVLDSSEVQAYNENVVEPAAKIVGSFLDGLPRSAPENLSTFAADILKDSDENAGTQPAQRIVQHCDMCKVTCATVEQWTAHTRSRKHRKLVSKAQRKDEKDQQQSSDNDQPD